MEHVQRIFDKYNIDPMEPDAIEIALDNYACGVELAELYQDEMPYGTQKARTGDPHVWLANKLADVLGIL